MHIFEVYTKNSVTKIQLLTINIVPVPLLLYKHCDAVAYSHDTRLNPTQLSATCRQIVMIKTFKLIIE